MKILVVVLGTLLAFGLLGYGIVWYSCERPRKWPTFKGVESPEVLAGIKGEVAFTPEGEGAVQRIGEKRARTIFTGTEDVRSHTIAGPDVYGRIALVDDDSESSRHALRIISPDGSIRTLFERSGDPLWGDFNTGIKPISEHIAMSPSGKVAILVHMKGRQFTHPDAYLEEGKLEIWSPDAKQPRSFDLDCLDYGMAWFPDNRRLAVVRTTTPAEIANSNIKLANSASMSLTDHFPAVWLVDTASGKANPLVKGSYPVVSQDGRSLSVEDPEGNVEIVDLLSAKATPVDLPGQYGVVIGITSDRRVIYWAIATEGTKVQTTKSNGLPGPRPMLTIKVVDLATGKFATVVPSIDPRSEATFGFLK